MDFSLTTPTLAQNCWPALPQTLVDEIFSKTRGELQDLTGIISSDTTPDPADQDKLWIKLDGSGYPVGQFYFASGLWVWPHPIAPSPSGWRQIWLGDPADIPTLDGGTAGVAQLTTGPFWEIDHQFDGRSPMGVGSIPTANPAHSIASGEQYGEGAHSQLADEVGPHTHNLASKSSITHDGVVDVVLSSSGSDDGLFVGLSGTLTDPLEVGQNNYITAQSAMPIIHPVIGVFFLRRTIRKYLTG